MYDHINPIICAVIRNKKLNDFGSDLSILDTCSNAPVTNLSALMKFMSPNYKSDVKTLGGGYKPPMTGFSDAFGNIDFDENLGMTVLSQRILELNGCTITRVDDTFYLKLKNCPIIIVYKWIDNILAGSLAELREYYENINTNQNNYASWTAHDTDIPSDLLKSYKIIPHLSTSDIHKLNLIHRSLKTMWSPSESELIERIKSGAINDLEFDEQDVRTYFKVFDYDLGALKGKTEDKAHDIVRSTELYKLEENEIVLYCDLFFICGLVFLICVDSEDSLVTTTCLLNKSSDEIIKTFKDLVGFYKAKQRIVRVIEFDKEPSVTAELVNNELHVSLMPRSTHVTQAEVRIKIVKQRVRTMVSLLDYSPPKTVLIHIVIGATMICNTLSKKSLNGLSPQEKFYGTKQSLKIQFAFCPSDYVEVHCRSDNSVNHFRTVSAIPLHPNPLNPNEWEFYSLETGKLFRRPYDEAYLMPMSQSIVDRLNYLATKDSISKDEELNIAGTDTNYIPRFIQPQFIRRGRPPRVRHVHFQEGMNDADEQLADNFLYDYFNTTNSDFVEEEAWIPQSDELILFKSIINETNHGDMMSVDQHGQTCYYATSKDSNYLCFASHMSSNQSKQIFGDQQTNNSIEDEINGLLQRNAFIPVSQENFQWKSKKVIPMSIFLRDKLDTDGHLIKLKARLVAGGHKQDRRLYTTEQKSSPTVNIQSILSILSIAASENRYILTFDVGLAFIEAEMDEELYMILDKEATRVLIKLRPDFAHFSHSGKILVQLKRALYGCIQSSKLWYNRIKSFLESIGFKRNELDACVFNRSSTIDGSQCTIGLHVDDGIVTCTNKDELNLLIQQLSSEFKLTVHEGPIVDYLGMKVDLSGDSCKLSMKNYIEELIRYSQVTSTARTPAASNLFDIDESSTKLDSTSADKFHSIVASLLYLGTRTRPDILLPVVFLCSRVHISTSEDQKKLDRILSYLNSTLDLPLIVGKLGCPISMNCYADASFAVHKDFKSHGSILISCGHGFIWCKCGKQKLVTKSSTEAELVTLSDAVSMSAWTAQFLQAQGYKVIPNIFQDNLSTIALGNNGRSNSDRTRHINIRYFFIKQYLDNGTMTMQHCPASDMIADILTKPLQGYEFDRLRNLLLGLSDLQFPIKN